MTPFSIPARSSAFVIFLSTASAPFALVCCSRASSDASGTSASATNAASVTTPSANPSASAPIETADGGQGIRLDLGAQSQRRKCEQIRRTMGAIIATSRNCSSDSDCEQVYTSCGLPGICGIAINRSNEAKVKGQQKPWDDMSCAQVVGAPCPTCAAPPAPRCVEGRCN